MALRIVQLGSERHADEGLRIGTVRRPPRGVPKAEFASRNYYDTWLPELSPSPELVSVAQQAISSGDAKAWSKFERAFRAEMRESGPSRLLDLLAALSHQTHFAIGCYCDDENRCHRSILRALLVERAAVLA